MDIVLDNNRRIGAHGTIKPKSAWDLALDVDSGTGQLRDYKDMSAFVYQRFSKERRIPRPYPASKFRWPPEKDIARIPAVGIVGGAYPTHSGKTLSPQISVDGQNQTSKRSTDDFKGQYPDISERKFRTLRKPDWSPYRKWTNQKLGFMSGQRVKPFGILNAIQNRVAKIIRGR